MRIMKTLFTIFFFTLMFSGLQAGFTDPAGKTNPIPPNRPVDETTDPATGSAVLFGDLTGIIVEENTDKPVEFATIGIYNKKDSSLVTGSITDENGKFLIERVPLGNYYVDVRFIGYANARVDKVDINAGQSKVNLGNIGLKQSTESIDEVEIVAQQAAVEYKIDKKVISVSQAVSAAGGSAADVLEMAPSIRTDVNGDVLLRGSSSFTVLIDGKPGTLEGNDALRQIPASVIQNIEIITNPSAEYEPDGAAGIINIVTKKHRQMGINGVADASVFTSGEYRINLNLNRRFEKLNLRGGVTANHRPTPYDWHRLRETRSGDTVRYVDGDGEWIWGFGGKNISLGADYEINQKNNLSLTANFGQFLFSYDNTANYKEYSDPATEDLFYREDNSFYVDALYFGINLNYLHDFDDKGQKITFNVNLNQRYALTGNESFNLLTDDNWDPVDDNVARQRGVTEKDMTEIQTKVDYVKPIRGNSTLKAGYQGKIFISPEDYRWERYDPDLGDWISDPVKSSLNDFSINIHGAYLLFQNNNKIVNFQAGMRTEYTDRLIESGTADEQYKVNRWDFYPSLNLSRSFAGGHQLQASYSRRVKRPQQWQLWPKMTYVDPTTVWQGNPLLDPEFTNAMELNYMKKFGSSFLTLETYIRQTDNMISWVYDLIEDDVSRLTFANLQNSVSYGSEVLANVGITKWWTAVGSVDFFRRQIDSRNIGTDKRTANSWNSKLDNSFKLNTGTRIQVSTRYFGESLTAQGSRDAYWMANLGIRQDLLKRKLILTLTIKDIFGTMTNIDMVESPDQLILTRQYLRAPIFGISLSYAINSFKQKEPDTMNLDVSEGGF
jgi:outer membrane receptor protein involved in Fe transport